MGAGKSSIKLDKRTPASLAGKVVVITRGNVGLGRQSAIELAKKGPAEIVRECYAYRWSIPLLTRRHG